MSIKESFIIERSLLYNKESELVIDFSGKRELFADATDQITISAGKKKTEHEIAPWGSDNMLPSYIIDNIGESNIVGANVEFNTNVAYGMGVKPMMLKDDGTLGKCEDKEVLDFFEKNDIDGYFLEQLTDLISLGNVFPEIVLSVDGSKIVSLRHNEAVFSRWGVKKRGDAHITRHYYAVWENGQPKDNEFTSSPVLPRFDTCEELRKLIVDEKSKERRFVLQVSMPTLGRTYYARPMWWSIFKSGWYDVSKLLPTFKIALMKNALSVRYIVYVSSAYWEEKLRLAKVADGDTEGKKKVMQEAADEIRTFLEESEKGGGLITSKRYVMGGGGRENEDKYIEIEVIKSDIKGGEMNEDSEEASNMICYAMGIHPSLVGATPGKSKGSLGGTDKRELFMIKQALLYPTTSRLLLPLYLIKRYNGWAENLVFTLPTYKFTTLDQEKSGKVIENDVA